MVADTEVEPVHMPLGVAVDPQETVKLPLLDFDDAIEVPSFEHAIEGVLVLDIEGRVHALESPVKQIALVKTVTPQPFLHEVRLHYLTLVD